MTAVNQQTGDRPAPLSPNAVLDIWQELHSKSLSPDSAQRFRDHPEITALTRYREDRLRAAGEEIYRRSGRLLLAEWARECAWDGGGSVVLDWEQFTANDPDAATTARDLLAAAVNSEPWERDRAVLAQRLGLDGDGAMTLQEIGEGLRLTRERVRQLQERAVNRMCRGHVPPSAANYAGRLLAGLIGQAVDEDVEPAVALLTLANAACPGIPAGFAVRVLARLAGQNPNASRHLAAEAVTLQAVRQSELVRETRQARSVRQAAERLSRMLRQAEWPGERAVAPPRAAISPQRDTGGGYAGVWPSAKLARDVAYESVAELALIRVLDRAPQVLWFCEQPAAIGYSFAGRHRTYYPDLLAATVDGCCLLVEVKPLAEMALAVNRAKAAAARAFCAQHGWGFLVTDPAGRTLQDLRDIDVPDEGAQRFARALHAAGTMTWRDARSQRDRLGLSPLQLSALAVQRGWDIRLSPYRISESASPRTPPSPRRAA